MPEERGEQIGRASCRERGEVLGGGGLMKKNATAKRERESV